MLAVHTLKANKSNKKPNKRVGRGNSSGKGTYSARGLKGQKSRSGGKSGLQTRSIKAYLLRIPKNRGFKSLQNKPEVVNLSDLENKFEAGNKVNARALLKAGLISTIANGVKVLSNGTLTKKLLVEANAFSETAKEKIEKAGGQATVVGQKAKDILKEEANKQKDA
ncbi:50S ribosomal protein L15 [Candidatus Nomurabacteria bacterium]|nr:50S ribosomal protein L15 [Candidatus Nomurabacteria bacterium]